MGVVVRRYIDFLILLIPTPLVSVLFAAASLLLFMYILSMVHVKKVFQKRSVPFVLHGVSVFLKTA